VAVVEADAGEDSPSIMRHQHHARRVKSGHVRTSMVTFLPSDQATKRKMATCFVPPRRNWHCTSAPITETRRQEWMSEKQLVLLEPTYPPDVLARQEARARAISARVTKMITNLKKQLKVIETGLASNPNELNLLRNQMEVENKLELTRFELNDVVEVKTTAEEAMAFSNSSRTYREMTDRLVHSRGKVYSLVMGQCTTVLLDKMKQDSDWQTVSDSYNPLKLLKMIEKYILKQSDNQYKIGIVIEQLKLLLTYRQDNGVTNTAYYD